AVVLTVALVLFVAARRRAAWFGIAWFAILIAPVLPLSGHLTGYYPMLPAIGLALAGAWAAVEAFQCRRAAIVWRGAAVVLLALYLAPQAAEARRVTEHLTMRSQDVRTLVLGVVRIRQMHPHELIVLTAVPDRVFWTGMLQKPFRRGK
ncbi:MAG TPA: hypothetical protein VF498_09070, partial [Anaerolineales bacterium]